MNSILIGVTQNLSCLVLRYDLTVISVLVSLLLFVLLLLIHLLYCILFSWFYASVSVYHHTIPCSFKERIVLVTTNWTTRKRLDPLFPIFPACGQ
jgi:hypothetical protein